MSDAPRPAPKAGPSMSPLHAAAITLGIVGAAMSIFVSGYWAIGLGVTGAILATSPARTGTGGVGRWHKPAFALCVVAVLLGCGAILLGVLARGHR